MPSHSELNPLNQKRLSKIHHTAVNVFCCISKTPAPVTNPPVTPKALVAGQKRVHPAHIPSHFPEFPDPHTYIKTPVSHCFFRPPLVSIKKGRIKVMMLCFLKWSGLVHDYLVTTLLWENAFPVCSGTGNMLLCQYQGSHSPHCKSWTLKKHI